MMVVIRSMFSLPHVIDWLAAIAAIESVIVSQ